MPIPSYTPGYPPDGTSLGQTKATIRNNLDGTFQTLNVDHINNNGQPGSKPAGYHRTIHQVTQTSVSTVSGYNQIFSGVPGTLRVNSSLTPAIPPTGDTQLYSLSGAGILSQLTGFSAANNGYVWVGGILFQWGVISQNNSQTNTVTFATSGNVNFPNNIFVAFAMPRRNSTVTVDVTVSNESTSGFNINNWDAPGTGLAYDWFAIGN